MGRHLCLSRFLCLVSSPRSLLNQRVAFLRPVPALRGIHDGATRPGTKRVCKPAALGWGTSKAGSLPGPGNATSPALRPWRGSTCHWLSHVARRCSAAPKPKAIPVWGTCSLREGIRFASEACLPVFVPLRAGSGAGSGRGGPQAAPRLGSRKWKRERPQPTCRSHGASVPTFNL